MHGQPLPLPHYCGIVVLPSVTSFTQSHQADRVTIITAIFKLCPPFCVMLHFQYIITQHLYKLAVNLDGHQHVLDITCHHAKNVITTGSNATCRVPPSL